MRILVAGLRGQIAQALCAADPDVHARGRPVLDLTKTESIAAAIDAVRPQVIVNAAAFTDVDGAETDPQAAAAVNRDGAAALARAACTHGIPLIHISTDYVFDGRKQGAYSEEDVPNPLNVYGRSKLDGERAVTEAHPHHVILRTCWVYSPAGRNFFCRILALAGRDAPIRAVDDQFGCPTYAVDAAQAILAVAHGIASVAAWGTFHMVANGRASPYEFAREVLACAEGRAELVAVASAPHPGRATRPVNTCMDCGKLADAFGISLPDWRDGVRRYVRQAAPQDGPA